MEWIMKGRCWKFGDNLSTDGAVMPLPEARKSHDPQVLKDYIMTGVDPGFPGRARRGDIIVSGKNFGHGNPHVWGYNAIREAGLGIIAESMARGGLRNAVTAGVLFLPAATGITKKVNQGDELEVNFRTGEIKDITSGETIRTEPLPEPLLEIIAAGGQEGFIKQKFARK
ncbi:MAG: 3-isopropylmalate dehydratase [Chloroflexota bacterium]